jgi:hypothetical protein
MIDPAEAVAGQFALLSMSSSALTLPIELYRQIVLDPVLNLQDLFSLSLTTHALSCEAYLALYSRIELCTLNKTKLALRTFIESDRVVEIVRELLLQPDETFRVDFGKETPSMIRAIHRMSNLKALTLGYLWTADPFGEAHNMWDAAAGPQSQLGPPGPGRTAWTRRLRIPFPERLTINANTYRPIRDLFGELPNPLPHLVCIRPLNIRDIRGIRRVTCERLYGQIPVDEREDASLEALECLEIANLDSYPTQNNWAPHLKTVSMIVDGGRGEYFITSRSFEYMKSVKQIGPVVCWQVSEVRQSWPLTYGLLARNNVCVIGLLGRDVETISIGRSCSRFA